MSFSIRGYVFEPPRVGTANSPYTMTPDNIIVDPGAYNAVYPDGTEPNPRAEYMALVMDDGLLVDATFGWTKNEVVNRFDFDGSAQRYRTLPGGPLLVVGVVGPTLNATRLKVPTPTAITGVVAPAPWRLSVGTGSGVTLASVLVSAFGAPAPGTVEILSTSGELNWNAADLVTYLGQSIRFQRQSFFSYSESNGKLGLSSDVLLLNPLPATGQFPLIRLGFGKWLTPVEKANEGAFSADPAAGTVEWAVNTGRLKFNSAAIALAKSVYYDGVLLAWKLSLPRVAVGSVNAPLTFPNQAAGEDLIFQLAGGEQFPYFSYVTAFDPVGSKGIVQLLAGGVNTTIQFSAADQATYGATAVTLVYGDLFIERGFSLRLFRTPVNLVGTPIVDGGTKDVTSVYTVAGATYANPIIGSPDVFLPQTPRDDGSLAVSVAQGTGTFTPGALPILDGSIPLPGGAGPTYGYILDYDQKKLKYAFRKNDALTMLLEPTGALALADPLVQPGALVFELETGPGTNVYVPLTIGTDILFDGNAQVTFIQKTGSIVAAGTGTFAGTALNDPTGPFGTVQPGDTLVVLGAVYTVAAVIDPQNLTTDLPAAAPGTVVYEIHTGKETMADRYFAPVELVDPGTKVERILSLGALTNAPRLSVPLQWLNLFRIRFGTQPTSPYSTAVNVVATDGDFTAPPQGVVEVSAATGNLNFSAADLGTQGFWARTLKIRRDYTITAPLGFINFTERFLAYEEALLTYSTIDQNTGLPVPVVEPAVFLVRKELCQPHPDPTATLYFNPTQRVVASSPVPAVFRGGRPQELGVQCNVSTANSTVTFLADTQITDALPHGPIVNPIENVYVDYYITQAMGGEQSLTVQLPPMSVAQVTLAQDASNFVVVGDQTATFPSGYLLRVENIEVHLIDTATYDAGLNQTTVTLVAGDIFQDAYNNNPQLYESSGPTRTAPVGLYPNYFPTEAAAYTTVPRGMNKVTLTGDRLASYKTGSVIRFTDGPTTFQHFYLLTSAALDENGNTVLTLASNTRQQYTPGTHFLSYSLHPILEDKATVTQTAKVPVLTEPYTVFRRVEGQVGTTLTLKTDYTIDESGVVTYKTPLVPSEEISIFYTGHVIKQAGIRLRSSYTALTVPTSQNGLLNQVLLADYTLDSPDTFYWRVETMTNFLAEISQQLTQSIQSTVPSGGPTTSNSAGGALYTKGRPSLYFDEKHIANQDIVSRKSLLWYNDTINLLEDALQDLDGRVVGHRSGRLLFDMTQGVQHPPGSVTNQIDDQFKVSDAPYSISFVAGAFVVNSIGTYQAMYLPALTSRFYPTGMGAFGVLSAGTQTGDEVFDLGHKNLTAVSEVQTRFAWARVTKDAAVGATTLTVDTATGSATLARPKFTVGMKCVIQKEDGTFIHGTGAPVTVGAVAQQSLTISALAGAVPAGSTIYRSPKDDSAQAGVFVLTYYQPQRDYNFNPDNGTLTYVVPYPPYDGSIPAVPAALRAVPLVPLQPIDAFAAYNNSLTAPFKFPALYGLALDDDGDTSFPVLTPSFNSEFAQVGDPATQDIGYLADQSLDTATIHAITTAPYLGTGSLDGTATIITNNVPFPGPTVPKVGDLARIIDGLNAGSAFRRITNVGASTITVDTPFASVDAGFQFLVTVSSTAISGVNKVFTTTQVTDPAAPFGPVWVGWTIVITSGAMAGARVQVTVVNSTSVLTFSPAITAGNYNYRVDNSRATFGGTNSLLVSVTQDLTSLTTLLTAQLTPTAEKTAIANFFEQVFTDIITLRAGTVSNVGTLTDAGTDFLVDGVLAGHVVYIQAGAAKGVYKVVTVAQHVLTVDPAFPVNAAVNYRVDEAFAVSFPSLQDAFTVWASIDDFIAQYQAFQTLATTAFPVIKPGPVADPTVFARGFLGPEFSAQQALMATRIAAVPGYATSIANIMGGSDRLYDGRYTWIDARINLKTGLFVSQQRAVAARVQAQADIVNQLFKLLSVSTL